MSTVIQASTEIDLEDAAVARTEPKDSDRELVARLVEQARADGVELVGENGLLGRLTTLVLESALEGEITDHLGYDKHQRGGGETGNSRNGSRSKTVLTDVGPVEISVPRDRDGSFEPKIVRKRQRRLSGVDEMVISLAGKGLTIGEISAHLAEVYGAEVSRQTISTITDKVLDGMAEWQNRPLDAVYPVIFIDAIHVKLRDGQVANRPVYVAPAVTVDGERDILGLWAGDGGEGAKFWLHVLTEIKNRGAGDALMVVCDGLKGLPQAIEQVWPKAASCRRASFTCCAPPSGTPPAGTGTPSPRGSGPSAPRRPRPRRWSGSWSSLRRGAAGIRPS
ncbi:Transposase, Mutator family [Nonomuraea pusilla]|uniref:Mutator family transposase n=1 Tax=Nonomuraea pusilla TaxID=46177 RepID=A0A1H7FDA6_9ACTN|nr:Transposase, Mutator family [Nonomuraea pusilla]